MEGFTFIEFVFAFMMLGGFFLTSFGSECNTEIDCFNLLVIQITFFIVFLVLLFSACYSWYRDKQEEIQSCGEVEHNG